jgi:hypothetical protein
MLVLVDVSVVDDVDDVDDVDVWRRRCAPKTHSCRKSGLARGHKASHASWRQHSPAIQHAIAHRSAPRCALYQRCVPSSTLQKQQYTIYHTALAHHAHIHIYKPFSVIISSRYRFMLYLQLISASSLGAAD